MSRQYNNALMDDLHDATNNETLDAARNLGLFQRLKAGDAAARDEMIVGNMPLAVAKVEGFIRCFPDTSYLRDDLTSAAMVGLTKAVNKMAVGKGPRRISPSSPVDFMGMWINRELRRLVEDETPIRVPHESRRLAKQKEEPIVAPAVSHAVPEQFETPTHQKQLEDRDLMESCCICDDERTWLAMRLAGHTNAAIARAINRPDESTRRLGKRVESRIKRKLEALADR